MRRIACLFLIVSACGDNNSNNSPDLSMVIDNDMGACVAGDPCTLTGNIKGVCQAGVCAACVDTTDDADCDTAYGEPNMHFICSGGACVVGCRGSTAAECGGKICSIATANQCGNCTTDAQCEMAVGAGNICNTTTGICVTSTCANPGGACANPADICCGNTCVAGSCCGNSECGDGGKSCVSHVCTSCPAPTGITLYVDPSETPGGAPTGADMPGCRYKTITAAMAVASSGSLIIVRGTQNITGTGAPCANPDVECFPIAIKGNVTVVGDSVMKPTILVPDGIDGFSLALGGSALSNLILDSANVGTPGRFGVVAPVPPTPSPSPVPGIDHVTMQHFNNGINVNGGSLDVKPGTSATNCTSGMRVQSSGRATVIGGADPISFSNNTQSGVFVDSATLSMSGTPGANGAGSIVANQNGQQGVRLSGKDTPQSVSLGGVVIWSNTANGVVIETGTTVQIRNCSILKNGASGIDIVLDPSHTSAASIDIGTGTNYGHNTLQDATNPNVGVGICSEVAGDINATGNVFQGHDCSEGSPMYSVTVATECKPSPSPGPYDVGKTMGGNVLVSNCTK